MSTDYNLELYPIYLHISENGTTSGFAPNVPGLFFAGDSIKECIEDAKSALVVHFDLLFEDGQPIPKATEVEEHLDDEDCVGGLWFLVEVDTARYRV